MKYKTKLKNIRRINLYLNKQIKVKKDGSNKSINNNK